MDETWEIGISKFRRCGGVAENICQRVGENGRGIFPLDSKLKSKIFVPSNLLINFNDIFLHDSQIRIKDDFNYPRDILDFFYFWLFSC